MSWKSIADLIGSEGQIAILGAPMEAGSVTPGRCDLAPEAVRRALKRFSTYDVERSSELFFAIRDLGDVPVRGVTPAEGFAPIRDAAAAAVAEHRLTLLLGGNNAITRPAAHALGLPLAKIGLITLDAHFDLRDTASGPMNGNPVRFLLEDGLPGANICQIGLAPSPTPPGCTPTPEPPGSASTPWRIAWSAGCSPCSTTSSPASSISRH